MTHRFELATKAILGLMILATSFSSANAASVSLNGSGTLSYTVTTTGSQPCSPNQRTITPRCQEWTFGQFVYTDGSGVNHSLSGGAFFSEMTGCTSACGGSGGSPVVLNGPGFLINVQPGAGILTASLNVLLFPKYYILSILYDPPGNKSSNAFSTTTSDGTTTSISHTFQSATTTTASVSIPGGSGAGVMWGTSKSTQNAQSFQVTTSTGNSSGTASQGNPINHTQDEFYLWLNPMVIVTPSSSGAGTYTLSTPPQGSGDPNPGQPQPMDIVNINVADLQNPSQIPFANVLASHSVVDANGATVPGLPGLSNLCANPVPACTSAPCGCTASDFAGIVEQDLLVASAQTTAPSQIDPNRFVFIEAQTLQGPQCSGCNLLPNGFTENDSTMTGETETVTNSYSVGYNITSGFDLFGGGFKLQSSNNFTWSNAMSWGKSSGQSHAAQVNLESSSVDCDETVNIYEDTVYHTFAFSLPVTPPAACQ